MIYTTSYRLSGLPEILGHLVHIFDPNYVVELGVQQGASAITIAKSLVDPACHLDGYDLFEEKYNAEPFGNTHASKEIAEENIRKAKLDNIISLYREDAFTAHKKYGIVDMLHIDICNHYDNVLPLMEQWTDKVSKLIVLEGGVYNHWQKEYGFKPFIPIMDMDFVARNWTYAVIHNYSSFAMTILTRRQHDSAL